MTYLGDNCIQNFHLGGISSNKKKDEYTVENLVLLLHASGAVKPDFQMYIRGYTSPN